MSENRIYAYRPYVGNTSDPDDPLLYSETVPTLTKQSDVQFSYPPDTPTTTLTLKTPEFGNRDRRHFQRIKRDLRGGGFNLFADSSWPRQTLLLMTFARVKTEEKEGVLTFLSDTLGQEIEFRDWENRVWRGVIRNPDAPAIQNRHYGFDISIEFEGELQ